MTSQVNQSELEQVLSCFTFYEITGDNDCSKDGGKMSVESSGTESGNGDGFENKTSG